MAGFWRKGERVQMLVRQHVDLVRRALESFAEATLAYVVETDVAKAEELMQATHAAESSADDVRREVEHEMVAGALLAPSRRQFLHLVDRVDALANAAQDTLHYLVGQSVDVPKSLHELVLEILSKTEALLSEVEQGVEALLGEKNAVALSCAERIDQLESAVDRLETHATRALFALDIDLARKLHVYGFIERLAGISDRGEDLADQMALVAAERAL
jgi:predicted phosphate transport protein (TIGR00153 family)